MGRARWCALGAAALFAVLCCGALLRAHGAESAAVITSLDGEVTVKAPGGKWAKGELLALLPGGASVKVGKGAGATLSFTRGGLRIRLSGPCQVQVQQGGVKRITGLPGAAAEWRPHGRTGVLIPSGVNIDRMGGGRRDAARGSVLSFTMDGVTRDACPVIRWQCAGDDFAEFEVTVERAGSARRIFRQLVAGAQREVGIPPGNALERGEVYTVRLRAYRSDGSPYPGNQNEPVTRELAVLSREELAHIETAEKEAQAQFSASPQDVSPFTILVTEYLQCGLFTPAWELGCRVRDMRPRDEHIARLVEKLDALRSENQGTR